MKRIQFILFALLLGATTIMISSCAKDDPCKDVKCGTYGNCAEGICICNEGYEKDAGGLCNTEIRTKFLGSYNASEVCNGSPTGSYSSTISSKAGTDATDVSNISISNFGDSGLNVTAKVANANTTKYTIESTQLTLGGVTSTVAGDATISGNIVTMHYTISQGGTVVYDCTATMTK